MNNRLFLHLLILNVWKKISKFLHWKSGSNGIWNVKKKVTFSPAEMLILFHPLLQSPVHGNVQHYTPNRTVWGCRLFNCSSPDQHVWMCLYCISSISKQTFCHFTNNVFLYSLNRKCNYIICQKVLHIGHCITLWFLLMGLITYIASDFGSGSP